MKNKDSKKIKIKPIDQTYTMQEITDIVDEIYPFGEFKTREDDRYIYVDGRNFDFDYRKKALMGLFFTLNKCNRIMAGQYFKPLKPDECKDIVAERERAYNQLQEIINPKKPQLDEKKEPLMQITDEAIDGLKEYFAAPFKGIGNNPDRFNDFLIPALRRCQTKKDIAELAKACYWGGNMIQKKQPKSWSKWCEVICKLFSIDRLPYKPNELPEPDYNSRFYGLN